MQANDRLAGCGGHDNQARTLDEALKTIAAVVEPLAAVQRVPVRDALGRVLAESVRSNRDVPANDNSAMDGYAVRSSDSRREALRLVGNAFAGHPYEGELAAGECVRIMTGGVVPRGADTVVMQEHTRVEEDRVVIERWPPAGKNVRRAGEDLTRDAEVLGAGRRVTAADLGLLAALGVPEVGVRRRPRVAFFSTGDELRCLGETLGPGELYDSNRYTLYGMLTRLGVEIMDLGVVPDRPERLRQELLAASENADVVLTSGGVSVGEADYMTRLLAEVGEVGFWTVALKPGRPLAFGRVGRALLFGLPGNPVSVMVTFCQIVAPTLRRLAGEPWSRPRRLRARCRDRLRKKPGRLEFQRGVLDSGGGDELSVASVGRQGSGILHSMSKANCFIVLALESSDVEPGEWVTVEPFDTLPLD